MRKITMYLTEFQTPKKALAGMIGIDVTYLYFYLEPEKYPDRVVSEPALRKIAAFENLPYELVAAEYTERRPAA